MKINFSFAKGLLWSRKPDSLKKEKDKIYLIHQVLAYGSLNQLKQLFRLYSRREIIKVFSSYPRKVYTPASFNFVKNVLLGLKKRRLSRQDYVKTLF